MIPPLKLREWTKSDHDLGSEQIAELQRIDGIRIEARSDGRFDVTPTGNMVGYVRRGNTSVVIHPSKCDSRRVIFMMGYADNPGVFGDSQVDFDNDEDLLEAFISVFVRSLTSAIERGLYRTYASIDDDLSVIRGRIRIGDQITRRFRLSPPIAVSFDEFTVDNSENRLLKAAIDIASRIPIRNKNTRDGLQYLRAMFSDVSLVEFDRVWLPEPVFTRLNEHLKYSLSLAKRIISNSSISLEHGDGASDEFLINMATVFEDFVVTALREELHLSSREMPRANELRNNPYLDIEHRVKLKPDISRWEDGHCVAIGDVKYKRTTAEGVVHPDIYQLLAYATATNLKQASVVYAMSPNESEDLMVGSHDVKYAGVTINVFALDLRKTPEEILNQISEFAKCFQSELLVLK
jgi:5-methylcytosine-specific restriction enzyme subunit McrC